MSNFRKALKEGLYYEQLLFRHLRDKGVNVKSVSDDKFYQSIGVDLIIKTPDNKEIKGEIKADSRIHETGNFFIEEGMERKTGFYEGWFYSCQADWLFYIDVYNNVFYLLDWPRLKQYIIDKNTEIKRFYNSIDACIGRGYLVNMNEGVNSWILKQEKLEG